MPLPRSIARFNRHATNRVLGPVAGRLPFFGIIEHRGRKTGRIYRTPINVFHRPGGYTVALTYGPGDWVQNVLYAGECTLETRGHRIHLVDPQLRHDEQRKDMPRLIRVVGRLGHVADFLELRAG